MVAVTDAEPPAGTVTLGAEKLTIAGATNSLTLNSVAPVASAATWLRS